MKRFVIRWFALYLLLNLLFFSLGCSTNWITEATGIIGALIPAVQGILVILSGLGVTAISTSAISSIQTWGNQAMSDLQNIVLPLINQYTAAEATAKPGILTEIETALATVSSNMQTVLGGLHITDPATQAKVTAIVTEVQDELEALVNLIPIIKPATSAHDAIKLLAAAPEETTAKLKSEKQFRSDYNAKAAAFGPQYSNWIR